MSSGDPTHGRMLISQFCTASLQSNKADLPVTHNKSNYKLGNE